MEVKNRRCDIGILLFLMILICLPAISFADGRLALPDFPLLAAVKEGDIQKVKSILGDSVSTYSSDEINRKGHTGDTPLSIAARDGNLEMVKLLVEHGATVDVGKETGERTPLMNASGQGHVEVVEFLIAKGADVNTKGKGLTPLLAACAGGHLPFGPPGNKAKTIRILLEKGADVNVQDESWLKTGRTPLMYAVMQGDAALAQAFLVKGAKLDLKNKDGDTALTLAKKEGLEYIAQLLEKSASGGSAGQPDLSLDPLLKAVKEGRLDELKALTAKGADVNIRTSSGSTLLMYAADGNEPEIVRHLLNHGADVNAKNGTNNTALIYASIKGHVGIVKELLKNKANPNGKNITRGDALIYAVLNKKAEVVRVLLEHGAKLNEKYDAGKTALMIAIQEGSSDIAKLLIAHKTDVNAADRDELTALMMACEKGNADVVETLLAAGADIDKKSKDGNTALSKAISANNVKLAGILVKNGGNMDRREALFSAVGAGNLEIVKLLLTKDADVNIRGFAGGTLLMSAAGGDYEIVKFLIERGADINKEDDGGRTALMKAVESFHETHMYSVKISDRPRRRPECRKQKR